MTGADLLALIKKHPVGVVCLLVGLACIALYFVRNDVVAENTRVGEEKSSEAAKLLANVRNSTNLSEQLAELQGVTKAIEGRLVHPNQKALNQQHFYRLETETGVKLVDVRQGAIAAQRGKAASSYVGVPFAINVQGSFKQVMEFLRQIETGPYFVKYNAISFNKLLSGGGSPAGGGDSNITLAMTVDILGQP